MTEPIRPEVLPLPARVRTLPVFRGYPVPWFVASIDGAPDFRVADAEKWRRALRERRCYVCGGELGRHLAFVIGPMCGINRTTSEPPCHLDCAQWSARACPFLSRPRARRREDERTAELQEKFPPPGEPIARNPGVSMVWVTRSFESFADPAGKPLIRIGDPERVFWYAEGRAASREEVSASIVSGLPLLQEIADAQDRDEPGVGAAAELARRARDFERLYPGAQM